MLPGESRAGHFSPSVTERNIMSPKTSYRTVLSFALVWAMFQTGCRPELSEESPAAGARSIHARVLTVDTHCDTAFRLQKEGRRAAFIGMENGYPVGKTLSNLEEYYKLGVRYVTLCHSEDNDICDSSTDRQDPADRGLSEFGREVGADCNTLGMMVDVSHASDKSFCDILKVTRAPIIASHSPCRASGDSPRNLADDMIRALAANE